MLLDTDIRIAVVSGIAAVLGGAGGVFAWVQAVRVTRIRAEAERALESMKLDTERRRRAFELASAETEPMQGALAQAWSDVQALKDAVSRTLSASRFDTQSAMKLVDPAIASLVEGYGRWGAMLPADARKAWHRAKDLAGTVGILVNAGEDYPAEARTAQLREIRHALTDIQLALATARATVRDAHVRRILEQL